MPEVIFHCVLENQKEWLREQYDQFSNFLWFGEPWNFTFEIHRYNVLDSLAQQSWRNYSNVILVYPDPSSHHLLFKYFTGTIGGGEEHYAPDMMKYLVTNFR
jgi:hypothetical protein